MAAADNSVLDIPSLSQTDLGNAPPVPQFNLPPTPIEPSDTLNFADLPPAMGAVGSHAGRGGNTIKNIILHSSDGRQDGDINTLTQSKNAGAHFYVTRQGQIIPLVNLDDTAYHAGRVRDQSFSNESTIGIEQEHFDPGGPGGKDGEDWPDAQVQATARLVGALQNRYGLTDQNVHTHSDIAFPAGRKQDPFNYPFDKFNQWAAAARSGQPVGQQAPSYAQLPEPGPIIYPWQVDPSTATVGDIFHQQQQRETGNLMQVANPQQPSFQARATHYGYPGDPDLDPNTAKGLGAANRQLGATSIALSPDIEQAQGAKLGDQFLANLPDGTQRTVTFDDRTNQKLTGRVDFYDKDGKIGDLGQVTLTKLGTQPPQQQIATSQAGPTIYPWQTGLSADQVNQAVQQSLQRNAFASAAPGVPAGYTPQAQTSGQAPQLVLSYDPQASTKPASFGMRVLTPDAVKQVDQYQANGGDLNALDPYDKLGYLLAKNPNTLLDPNNAQMLDEMVLQPQKAASAKKTLSEKIWDGIGAGVSGLQGMAGSVGALIRNGWQDAAPAARYIFEKATGQTPDPDATKGLADLDSIAAQGSGKTVSDVYNLVSNAAFLGDRLNAGLASMMTNDPQKLAQIHTEYLHSLQDMVGTQQAVAGLGNNLQSGLAQAYSATGIFSDLGQRLKTWQSDPQAAEGVSTLAQFIAPEMLAGMKGAGVFKAGMAERALEAGTDVSEANARKFLFDSTQKVAPNAAEEAANPNYLPVRTAQANLAPDARAADAAAQAANAAFQAKLTSLGKIAADPGTATSFATGLANAGANVADAVASTSERLNGLGDRILNALPGGPDLRGLYDKLGKAILFGVGAAHGHVWGARLAELAMDAAENLEKLPQVASGLRDFFKTYGQEAAYGETTVPFWTRMSQGTKLISPRMASFLDSPAVQTFASGIKGLPGGAATGAFIGALGDQNDPITAAVAGATQGGMFGMVGGGFGQWMRYGNPAEVYLKARGDWQRTRSMMSGPERTSFESLVPRDQLMLSTYLQQMPGLRVNFVRDPVGVSGQFDPHIHTFDSSNHPQITINLANPEGTVRGIFAHEFMHGIQSSGMLPDYYDALLGNPDRGTPGQYTAVDGKGNPIQVDPATGRYTTNQEFQNFKRDYIQSLVRSGEPTSHLSDLDIAKEIVAEHGVNYLLSPQGAVDAQSAFRPSWMNANGLKNAYAKLGFVFDKDGNLVTGTHLFDGLQRNDAVDKLAQKYFQTKFRDRAIENEEIPTRVFRMEDLRTGNAADTFLDTAPEIMRNPNGSVMRDARGIPLMRTPKQVREYNAKLANDTLDRINALPDDRKNDIGYRILPNGNVFVRYLPQELRDGLAKTNEYNPHQLGGLNALSEMLADKSRMGTNFRIFYHKALTEGKRYGSFSGSEKFAVPYGYELSKNDNIILRSVDFDQLNQNYLKNATRAPFRQLWGNPGEFVQDANSYFQNHSRGEPGATGIGEAKRDAINSLLALNTSVNRDANPLLAERGRPFPATRPIMKSYRIDRTSQITPLEMTSPFHDVSQYERMNRNFRPGMAGVSYLPRKAGAPAEAAPPPDSTAIPVTMRTTSTGKDQPEKIDYGITSAPLVSDKQPSGPLSENNFGHVDFLTKPEQQKLTALDKNSAVTTYADKLVDEFGKWKDNKEVTAAKTWYTDVRGYLKKAFGKDAEMFGHLLAATSPQQGVVQNWRDALEAYHRYQSGAFDDAIRQFKKTGKITEDMKPTKANGAKFGANSDAVLKVLSGTWLDSVEGPKTPNFFANLFGRGKEATIDKWAARTMRRLGFEGVEGAPDQWRLTPPSEKGVSDLDFAFSQQAFRQAADRLKIDPHELQAIMWYAEKHNWAEKGWSKGGPAAAKASYVPMLKEYAAQVQAKGGPTPRPREALLGPV